MSLNLIPRKRKKLNLIPRKRKKTRCAGVCTNNGPLQAIIQKYLIEFKGVVKSRIGVAMRKYPTLRRGDVAEDMYSRFCEKFTACVMNRNLQLWRANDKMINVYVQQMIENIIIDTLRNMNKHEGYTRTNFVNDDSDDTFENLTDNVSYDAHATPYVNGEYAYSVQQLYRLASERLKEYNPDGYLLMLKLLDPKSKINLSSPKVHNLKREFKAILESLR